MKSIKDKFSSQASTYKKYRPTYPQEVYDELLDCLTERNQCWDCGTGNGQVAIQLAKYFKQVYATDISQKQLDNAELADNIIYKVERAENTHFDDDQFDLITVAQAIHWFDHKAFNKEVKRVLKNNGILAVWGYGLLRINSTIDPIVDDFYHNTIGAFWNDERKHIDDHYQSIQLDGKIIPSQKNRFITNYWTLNQMEGYLNSWSSVQNYKNENDGKNPVNLVIQKLENHWKRNEKIEVNSPVFMHIRKIEK